MNSVKPAVSRSYLAFYAAARKVLPARSFQLQLRLQLQRSQPRHFCASHKSKQPELGHSYDGPFPDLQSIVSLSFDSSAFAGRGTRSGARRPFGAAHSIIQDRAWLSKLEEAAETSNAKLSTEWSLDQPSQALPDILRSDEVGPTPGSRWDLQGATEQPAVQNSPKHIPGREVAITGRLSLLKRLIWRGQIVEAMSAFHSDLARFGRLVTLVQPGDVRQRKVADTFSADGATLLSASYFEQLALWLRQCLVLRPSTRPPSSSARSSSSSTWRPPRLDPTVDIKSLALRDQVLFASAAVYDACIANGFAPTSRTVSVLLSTFAVSLPPSNLLAAVEVALRGADAASSPQTQNQQPTRHISLGMLSALIAAFGRAGVPEQGEALLRRWASERQEKLGLSSDSRSDEMRLLRRLETRRGLRSNNPSHGASFRIPLTGWSHDTVIWQSLMRARVLAGDLNGARDWFERWRSVAICPDPAVSARNSPIRHPSPSAAPYLTMMHASAQLERNTESQHDSSTYEERSAKRTREVYSYLFALERDGVRISTPTLNFLLMFEARARRPERAAQIFVAMLKGKRITSRARGLPENLTTGASEGALESSVGRRRAQFKMDQYTYAALFQLYVSHMQQHPASMSPFKEDDFDDAALLSLVRSPRALLGHLLRAHHARNVGRPSKDPPYTQPLLTTKVLNAALAATLAVRDFPAALVALRTFAVCAREPDADTHRIIFEGCVRAWRSPMPAFGASFAENSCSAQDIVEMPSIPSEVIGELGLCNSAAGPARGELAAILGTTPYLSGTGTARPIVHRFTASPPSKGFRETRYLARLLSRLAVQEVVSAAAETGAARGSKTVARAAWPCPTFSKSSSARAAEWALEAIQQDDAVRKISSNLLAGNTDNDQGAESQKSASDTIFAAIMASANREMLPPRSTTRAPRARPQTQGKVTK